MRNIHFISGLPRSGSTLLAAILSQNPEFHASISSPLAHIFNGAWVAMGPQNEGVNFISDLQRDNILRHIVKSFYGGLDESSIGIPSPDTIFDTSRLWTAKTHLLFNLFPDAKMICCVRNVAWVLDSVERLIRKNYLSPSKMFQPQGSLTVFERVNALVSASGMVGCSYNALREACFGEYAERILIVDYDRLIGSPLYCMDTIFKAVGEKPFDGFNFSNIAFPPATEAAIAEFDARLNTPGLHSVRPKLERIERETILPPEMFAAHCQSDFWNNDEFKKRFSGHVI